MTYQTGIQIKMFRFFSGLSGKKKNPVENSEGEKNTESQMENWELNGEEMDGLLGTIPLEGSDEPAPQRYTADCTNVS